MFLFSSSRESGKRLARSCEKRDSWLAQVGQVKFGMLGGCVCLMGPGDRKESKTMGNVTHINKITTSIVQLAASQPTLASFRSRRDAKRSCDERTCNRFACPCCLRRGGNRETDAWSL